jgi:hypothetical protein
MLNISRDEEERARLMSELKYELDTQSKVSYALKQTARNMKGDGVPIEQIAKWTGLDEDQVREL